MSTSASFTPESAKSATFQQAQRMHGVVAKESREVVGAAGSLMAHASLAVYAGIESGYIGGDSKGSVARKDYAAGIMNPRTGSPYSASQVTLWHRLGVAQVVHGITPDSDPQTWTLLAAKAGANVKEVADALLSGKVADVKRELGKAFTPEGVKVRKSPATEPAKVDAAKNVGDMSAGDLVTLIEQATAALVKTGVTSALSSRVAEVADALGSLKVAKKAA